MNKFTIEITPKQLVALNTILTSIDVENYEMLPLLKSEAREIASNISNAQLVSEQPILKAPDIVRNGDIEYIPNEFEEIFDMYASEGNGFLIDNEENLRFVYGRQGQVGIYSWEYYDYDKEGKADTVIYINSSDAKELFNRISRATNDFKYDRKKLLNSIENIDDRYDLRISNHADGTVAILYKKTKTDSIDTIKFYNEKQIRLFFEFLKYHMGEK